jgi:23S rRNA (adenine2503-C2)-methyltransferase
MPVAEHSKFFGFLPAEFDALCRECGWPVFRAKQVRNWVFEKGVVDPEQMSNLSKTDRALLTQRVEFGTSTVLRRQTSSDGTDKILLGWPDGATAEAVMIPDGPRRTACISSQVGCPVGCRFCASGINGVKGNLSADRIVEQVFRLNENLAPPNRSAFKDHLTGKEQIAGKLAAARAEQMTSKDHITNIVFMGMGEPLANYAQVMKAVRILHDPECFNIGGRKITISTVGVPAKIRQLATEELPLNLAISLHAPNEELRKQLIPWAEHFAMEDILEAARFYFDQTGREITLEYILLSGVNDRPEHARQLAMICKTLRANVNLIRYNEVEGLPFSRPLSEAVVQFQEILRNNKVNAHVRKSRGRDIDAACGQLRRREEAVVQLGSGSGS